jgi:hypothetical protein
MDTNESNSELSLRGVVIAALGAVASGIGVIGFLIFVGGAVQAARDRGVGLSAPFAVPLVPRTQLLTSGADQLFAPFVLTLGVLGVAVIYLVVRRRLSEIIDRWLRWLLLLGAAAGALVVFRHQAGDPVPAPFAIGDRETAFTGGIFVLAFGGYIANRSILSARHNQGIVRSPQLLLFLAVIGATAIAFSALETFAHNEWRPQVHPLALVSPLYPHGLTGVYVGEDTNYVYVGIIYAPLLDIKSNRLQARVLAIKRSDITSLSVGGLFQLTNFPSKKTGSKTHREADVKLEKDWRKRLTDAEKGLLQELLLTPRSP